MNKPKTFSENLREVEEIIEKLEGDDVSLEETIDLYKSGMRILKECSQKIETIEKELMIIDAEHEDV